ncbi:MAG TPA: nuclear transport factor 2 family protein [Chloroflexota bacterium]
MGFAREAAEQAYAVMAAGDIDGLLQMCTPDCELIEAGNHLHGPDQIGPYLRVYFTALANMRPEIRSIMESDDTVAAEISFVATEPADATPSSDIDRADFMTFRDGKIAHWHVYIDLPAS